MGPMEAIQVRIDGLERGQEDIRRLVKEEMSRLESLFTSRLSDLKSEQIADIKAEIHHAQKTREMQWQAIQDLRGTRLEQQARARVFTTIVSMAGGILGGIVPLLVFLLSKGGHVW